MVNKENIFFHKNINIENLHYPFLIVDADGIIVDYNDKACKLFELQDIPKDFLLKKGGNRSFLLTFLNSIIENRYSNHTYLYPISVNDKSLKVFNSIYFVFSFLKDDLCLIKIKKLDLYNDLESEYIRIIKYGEALNKSSLVLNKLDKDSPKKALSYIFKVSAASRIYIFKNFTDENSGVLSTKCIEEICAPNILSVINRTGFSSSKFEEVAFRWKQELSAGRMLSGYVKNFPKSELKYFARYGTEYVIIVPIITDSGLFGFLGMDFCYKNVKTTVLDFNSLNTLGKQLSNYYSLLKIEKLSLSANEMMAEDLDYQQKMISVMINSVKSLLNEIIELSSKLNFNIKNLDERQVVEYNHLIFNAASSVNNIVDYSSKLIEFIFANNNYDLDPISATEIIGKSISLYKEFASQKAIILMDKSKKGFFLYTNEDVVLSVFNSILINAIKFSPEGTAITMLCKIDPKIKGNIVLCIEGWGIGISKEKMSQLYEPISKIPNNIDRNIIIRLGMQISKRILNHINGELYAESIEGKGSSVYISIPAYIDNFKNQ